MGSGPLSHSFLPPAVVPHPLSRPDQGKGLGSEEKDQLSLPQSIPLTLFVRDTAANKRNRWMQRSISSPFPRLRSLSYSPAVNRPSFAGLFPKVGTVIPFVPQPFPRYLSPSYEGSWVRSLGLAFAPSRTHCSLVSPLCVCWRAKWVGWVIHWSQIKGFIETRPMTQQQIEKMTVRDKDGTVIVRTCPLQSMDWKRGNIWPALTHVGGFNVCPPLARE